MSFESAQRLYDMQSDDCLHDMDDVDEEMHEQHAQEQIDREEIDLFL